MEPVVIKVGYLVQAGGGNLPVGNEGQFIGYGAGGVPVAVDAPAGGGYDDTEVRGLIGAVGDKADANAATIAAFGPTAWADITDRPATFAPSAHTHAWGEITGKPTTFAPSAHAHVISEITDLQAALDGKQPTTTFKTVNGTDITGTGDIAIPAGEDGQSVTITTVTSQAAYDAATPGPLEIVVRTA